MEDCTVVRKCTGLIRPSRRLPRILGAASQGPLSAAIAGGSLLRAGERPPTPCDARRTFIIKMDDAQSRDSCAGHPGSGGCGIAYGNLGRWADATCDVAASRLPVIGLPEPAKVSNGLQ